MDSRLAQVYCSAIVLVYLLCSMPFRFIIAQTLLYALLLLCMPALMAQQKLMFVHRYGVSALEPENKYYPLHQTDSIRIDLLRYYISGIELRQNDTLVYCEANSYHLIDAADTASGNLTLPTPSGLRYNRIQFNLGIDSLTNVSGAMGGDLDPTRGMYWTWQSGYINFKLEGRSNLCRTRKSEFQFHLGGYMPPYASLQTISLQTHPLNPLRIVVDIEQLLKAVELSMQNHIMSPGPEAVKLSRQAALVFSTPLL